MYSTVGISYDINNECILTAISEFMCDYKNNIVICLNDEMLNKYTREPKMRILSKEYGVELYIIDRPSERVILVSDNAGLYGVYSLLNKKQREFKSQISLSRKQHKLYNNLIGLYCNLPKSNFRHDNNIQMNYRLLELCVLEIFNLSARTTRVSSCYSDRLHSAVCDLTDNVLRLTDMDEDKVYTYNLNIEVIRNNSCFGFNNVRIKFYGDMDSMLHGLMEYMYDTGVDTQFRKENISIVKNKILELEME